MLVHCLFYYAIFPILLQTHLIHIYVVNQDHLVCFVGHVEASHQDRTTWFASAVHRTGFCRCAANLNLQLYEKAVEDADKAVELDETNVKAIHRRATANLKLQNFDAAVRDFEKVSIQKRLFSKALSALHSIHEFSAL